MEHKYAKWYIAYNSLDNLYVAQSIDARRRITRTTLSELASVLAHESIVAPRKAAEPILRTAVSFRLPAEQEPGIESVVFAIADNNCIFGGLRELTVKEHDKFVMALGRAVDNRKEE